MKGIFCGLITNPVVKKIAKEYKITKEDALVVYDNVLQRDATLQHDKVTFKEVVSSPAFAKAMKPYGKNPGEISRFVSPAAEDQIRNLTKEFKEALGDGFSDEEIADIIDRASEASDDMVVSNVNAKRLAKIMDAFPNTRRLEFLGDWVCKSISCYITILENNPKQRAKLGIAEHQNRADYFLDVKTNTIIRRQVKRILESRLDEIEDEQLKKEIRTVIDNFDTILFMYGSRMYATEGVRIGIEGLADKSKEDSDQERAETDRDESEELTLSFSASDSSESVTNKILPEIRGILRSCIVTDSNGDYIADQYGYGLESFVGESRAVDSILRKVQGCQTYEEMREALQRHTKGTPWLSQVLNILDDNSRDDNIQATKSRKEHLRTLFFTSFRKQFTEYIESYMNYNDESDGQYMATRTINRSSRSARMYLELENKFFSHSGTILHSGNTLNINAKDKNSGLYKIYEKLASLRSGQGPMTRLIDAGFNTNYLNKEEDFAAAEKTVLSVLRDFGLNVTTQQLETYLASGDVDTSNPDIKDKDSYIRYSNLSMLVQCLQYQANNFRNLDNYAKTAPDNIKAEISINPLSTAIPWKDGKNGGNGNIRGMYRRIIDLLTKYDSDNIESMAYANGKTYYSSNNPSSVQTIIENLTNKNSKARQNYINRKYGIDSVWFKKTADKFYSDNLNMLFNDGIPDGSGLFSYAEKVAINGKSYDEVSDADYALSILSDFFDYEGTDKSTGRYRMFISADKPKYATLRLRRYTREQNYKKIITEKGLDYLSQELRRAREVVNSAVMGEDIKIKYYDIKENKNNKKVLEKIKKGERVSIDDVIDDNGRYVFRNSGASFFFNKFLNEEIEKKTELGNFLVDRIFNQKFENKSEDFIPNTIVGVYKNGFKTYMRGITDNYLAQLKRLGVIDENKIPNYLLNWHRDELNDKTSDLEARLDRGGAKGVFNDDVEEFVYNNWLAKVEMIQIFDVDPAFYGDTVTFQKRNSQVTSAGIPLDPNAQIHGENVSDGKFRSITIATEEIVSDIIGSVKAIRSTQPTATDKEKQELANAIDDIVGKLSKVDSTDGQAVTGITALRKRLVSIGQWTRSADKETDALKYKENGEVDDSVKTDEAIYQRIIAGKATSQDWLHVFAQPQKPFVYGLTSYRRKTGRNMVYPVQHKNSEYMLSYLMAYMGNQAPDSTLGGIAKFLEWSAYREEIDPVTGKTHKVYAKNGIDTVNMDSAVKIGDNTGRISLKGLTGQQVYETLQKAAYDSKHNIRPGIVTEYDIADYKFQQTNPEHLRNNQQPLGSQMRFLSVNNIKGESLVKVEIIGKDGKRTVQTITGDELRRRYFDALDIKTSRYVRDFTGELGLNRSSAERKHRLSNLVKRWLSGDARNGVELRRALSITERNGNEEFLLPWDDPAVQQSLETMVFSKFRKTFYRQKTNGGPAVQATSWGHKEDLNVVFTSSSLDDINNNNGLLLTKKQYADRYGLTGDELDKKYEAYANLNTSGLSHFEMEITMPDYIRKMLQNEDGSIDEELLKNGHWNMDAIKKRLAQNKDVKDIDSLFEAIAYRIPTESKYSMMPCRIVRFADECSGSVVKFPKELTVFTGSDFDIDKSYIELRPLPGSKNADIDNEIFSLQYGALRSREGLWESLRSGDFSDLSELSYKVNVLTDESNAYPIDDVMQMSSSKAKTLSQQIEDLDFLNPFTDVLLHAQNAEAKEMIGIAAVGVVSHAAISMTNGTMINFYKPSFKRPFEEKFVIINDSNGKYNVWSAGDKIILDDLYDVDGHLIGSEIGKYVGASADAAKDAALYRLNITRETLPLLITMHRLGISADAARLFIRQPIIKQLVSEMKNNPKYRDKPIGDVAREMQKDIMEQVEHGPNAGYELERINKKIVTLHYSELLNGLKSADPYRDVDILHVLISISNISNSIHSLDAFARYNSTAAMKGSSIYERFAERQKIMRLRESLNGKRPRITIDANLYDNNDVANYDRLVYRFPNIARTIDGEDYLIEQVLQENEKTFGATFLRAAQELGVDADAEALKVLHSAWKNYLIFASPNRIANFADPNVARKYTVNFVDEIYNKNEVIQKLNSGELARTNDPLADNTFLNSIGHVRQQEPFDFTVLVTNVNGLTEEEKNKYMRDWESLLDDDRTKKLAVDLAIHFMTRQNGAAFGNQVPTSLIPLRIKEAIPNYFKAFSEAEMINMDKTKFTDFIMKACLNNYNNDSLVPKFLSENITWHNGGIMIPEQVYNRDFSKYTEKLENKSIVFKPYLIGVPVDGQYFLLDTHDSNVVISNGFAYINAKPAKMLGLLGQYQEFTPTPYHKGSVLYGKLPEDIQSRSIEHVVSPEFGTTHISDSRVGTYVNNSPYEAEEVFNYDALERYLVSGEKVNTRNAYLESRKFLKRTREIASALGLRINNTHRQFGGWFSTEKDRQVKEPSYSLNVIADSFEEMATLHQRARLLAMLSGTLGFQAQEGNMVITYVDDFEDATNAEFRIKLKIKNRDYSEVFRILRSLQLDQNGYSIDTNSNEIYFIDEPKGDGTKYDRLAKALSDAGLAENAVEINPVIADFPNKEDRKKEFNKLLKNDKVSKNISGVQGQDSGRTGGDKTVLGEDQEIWPVGTPFWVRDYISAALRIENGEKLDKQEIALLFGERVESKLAPARMSFESRSIVDETIANVNDTTFDMLERALEGFHGNINDRIDSVIVNTYNWILENQDNTAYSLLKRIGMNDSANQDIRNTIKAIIEKNKLC